MTHLSLNSGSRILMSHWYPADTVWQLALAFCALSLSLSLCRVGGEGERESLAMCHHSCPCPYFPILIVISFIHSFILPIIFAPSMHMCISFSSDNIISCFTEKIEAKGNFEITGSAHLIVMRGAVYLSK